LQSLQENCGSFLNLHNFQCIIHHQTRLHFNIICEIDKENRYKESITDLI
jgi:hypothetical protein